MTLNDEQMAALAERLDLASDYGRPRPIYFDDQGWAIMQWSPAGWEIITSGIPACIEGLQLDEPHWDDEESDRVRCYKRRRYGGTEFPYADTLQEAVTAAVIEVLNI